MGVFATFREFAQQMNKVEDRIDGDITLLKKRCKEHERLGSQLQEVLKAVERERHDRIQDLGHVKTVLTDLRADFDGACQSMNNKTSKLSKLLQDEGKERKAADADLKHQLGDIEGRMQDLGHVKKELTE